MKLIGFKTAVAVGVIGLALNLQAVQITGSISLAGGYTVNTGDLNTATAFTSFNSVYVPTSGGVSGAYATANILKGVTNSVTITPFSFSPFSSVTPLWQTVLPGQDYAAFDLTTIQVARPFTDSLVIIGTGTLYLAGYDPTPGTWSFSANQSSDRGTFSFSSSNAAQVPDGGTTALLLGSAMAALALIRRKIA